MSTNKQTTRYSELELLPVVCYLLSFKLCLKRNIVVVCVEAAAIDSPVDLEI